METDIRKLIGLPVVVEAGDVTYRGILRELGLRTILVQGTQGHREIAWDRILRVREDRRTDGR